MSEANIELNKSKEPVFKEAVKEEQRESLLSNKSMDMMEESEKRDSLIPELENKIENSFILETNVKKKGKEAPEAGPKHIALEERFAYDRVDDDSRMLDVRRKLKYYFKSVQEGDTKQQVVNLERLIKECDAYCKGRFMIFKWGRGKERLKEVKALKRDAEQKLETIPKNFNGTGKVELIYNGGPGYVSRVGAAVVLGRFLIENPIRLALTAIALPFWAVNEGIRAIQKRKGKVPNRRLRLPWMHRWGYYVNQQVFKKKTIGFSTYRSFKDRIFKHKTDIRAMERAIQDVYSTTEEGFDYEGEEADEAEEEERDSRV